jgi:hypothetical protein
MSTSVNPGVGTRDASVGNHRSSTTERRTTETKAAFKTTEFIAYLAVLAGILVAGLVTDDTDSAFGAEKVWLYSTILTVGYMISRGLAKSGSRDPYTADRNDR